jgi:excisionase family DNA binding protein
MAVTEPANHWLTKEEAADYLSVGFTWMKKALVEGTLPHHKFGRLVRIRREDLDAYIAEQRRVGVGQR